MNSRTCYVFLALVLQSGGSPNDDSLNCILKCRLLYSSRLRMEQGLALPPTPSRYAPCPAVCPRTSHLSGHLWGHRMRLVMLGGGARARDMAGRTPSDLHARKRPLSHGVRYADALGGVFRVPRCALPYP